MADDTQGQGQPQGFSPLTNLAGPGGAPLAYSPQGIQQAYLQMQREKAAQQRGQPIRSWTQVAAGILDTFADQIQLNRMMQQYQTGQAGAAQSAVSGVFGDLGGGEDVSTGPAPSGGGAAPAVPAGNAAQPGGNVQSYQGDGTPDALTNFVKQHEGFSATPYADGKQTSIGYGTRAQPGDTRIDQVEGNRRLNDELGKAAAAVHSFNPNLPGPVAHALTDLTYNAGTKWMDSGLGKAVQSGDWATAKDLFTQYSHAGGQFSQGLYNRRQAMAPMFDQAGGGAAPGPGMSPSTMAFNGAPAGAAGAPPMPGGTQGAPAPQTAPAATASAPGGFIPPSQQVPRGISRTIQTMIANPNPQVQAEGFKLLNDWQTRLAPQTVERGGMTYSGNPYVGYKPTGVPSKPDIQRMDIEAGGVKVPRPMQPEYDASGRMTGYRDVPILGGGAGGAGAPTDVQSALELGAKAAGTKKLAEEQAATDVKKYEGLHTGLTGAAQNAAQQAQNLAMLQQIAPDAYTGTGANASLALNRLASKLGINPAGAAPRELFNQLAARVLADQFAGIRNLTNEETAGAQGSRIFKSMLDIEEKANITHEDTLEGVQAKLKMLEQAGKMAMRWGDLADDYKTQHGRLDPSFMKTIRKDISESRFEDIVPKETPSAKPTRGDIESEMKRRGLLK